MPSATLESLLSGKTTKIEREEVINTFLSKIEGDSTDSTRICMQDGLEWMNTTKSLNFATNLKGKLVVLDFFTYCCINCMHILPDLERLEEKFTVADGLVIVGVHSAKFENEKTSANILSAILRYGISHPVVNDEMASLWNELEITCWPTLVVVSPTGKRLVTYVGEGHFTELQEFCTVALNYYKTHGLSSEHDLPIKLAKDSLPSTALSFPGKVGVSPDGECLVISDTGHHCVLVTTKAGVVLHTVGGQESGYKDGRFEEARMNCPQGVVWHKHSIYVADTENHLIRLIDLKKKVVSTVAGTGEMGEDKEGGNQGTEQPISSPWDVAIGGPKDSVLFIAMAGTHQIWTVFLEDTVWLKGITYKKGMCARFAGSGQEENRNNSYPHKAGFAQPSGISLARDEKINSLFVADSESSSVRSVALKDGATKGVVGGERDPMNLFAYGDVDGKGVDAKLQHPLGVAWNQADQKLYVADSYNHKIKMVDPLAKTCVTLAGNGKPGKKDCSIFEEVEFNEPGGLCVTPDGSGLFVADTNNHAIRHIDFQLNTVKELNIITSPDQSDTKSSSSQDETNVDSILSKKCTIVNQLETVNLHVNSDLTVHLDVHLPKDCTLTEGAPCVWQAYTEDSSGKQVKSAFQQQKTKFDNILEQPSSTLAVADDLLGFHGTIKFEVKVYYCEASGTCHMQGILFTVPVNVTKKDPKANSSICLRQDIS
ncbi:NHL repeat-containing protein 2-like [Anneissia japonica]|uniref:NHL repeat-containing protein 2-like n=1 Tax=Anneissia japonica TaxID=1529436 RepID=UPI001425AFDD|nr:NHL repeat-containing protein 2-like [Anneissia japonica]XP_033109726.1 NHL repeat-containing protein 2-like [Anneissia japonica]